MTLCLDVVVVARCSFYHKDRTVFFVGILIISLFNLSRTDGFTHVADLLTSLVDV
jgi:hypothetical protein